MEGEKAESNLSLFMYKYQPAQSQKERIRTCKLKGYNLSTFRQEVQTKMNRSNEVTCDKLKLSVVELANNICGVTRGQSRKEQVTWWWMEEGQETIQNTMAFKNWLGNHQDAALKAAYKAAKKAVAMAKSNSMKLIYENEKLNIKEGEAKINKITKARQRRRQDKQSINIIKDRHVKILTEEVKLSGLSGFEEIFWYGAARPVRIVGNQWKRVQNGKSVTF